LFTISDNVNAAYIFQLKKVAEKLGPETTELQRFLTEVSGAEFSPPSAGIWNITETVKSATFSPLPPPARHTTEQLQNILGTTLIFEHQQYSFLKWAIASEIGISRFFILVKI